MNLSSMPELDPVGAWTSAPRGVEAALGQQPDRGSVVGSTFGNNCPRSQGSISGNLRQRPHKRFKRIALALVIDPQPIADLDGAVRVVNDTHGSDQPRIGKPYCEEIFGVLAGNQGLCLLQREATLHESHPVAYSRDVADPG